MSYKKEIKYLFLFALSGIILFIFLLVLSLLNLNIGVDFFNKYELLLITYFSLCFTLIIPSLVFFFVKESVYTTWRNL
jgi:hypothetical protein